MFRTFLICCALCFTGLIPAFCQESDSLVNQAIAGANLRERLYDYEGAITELDKPEFDEHFYINLRIGGLYAYLGKYQESIKHYQKAYLAERNSLEALEGIMNAYYLMMDYGHAKIIASKILSIAPFHRNASLIAAQLAMANLDFIEAQSRLEKLLSVWPLDLEANVNLGYCMIGMRHTQRAKKILSLLKYLYPDFILVSRLEASMPL